MTYAILKCDAAKADEIREFYGAERIEDEKHPYDVFDTEEEGVHIHGSVNKKEVYTIVFSGKREKVKEIVSFFSEDVTYREFDEKGVKQHVPSSSWEDTSTQIGSDEVGKGDFFGPLIVTASYLEKKDIPLLISYGVDDSKKMKDETIREIGPALKAKTKSYTVMLSPEKLSRLAASSFNMDHILSLLHNSAQKGLIAKYSLSKEVLIYVDQFTPEEDYRRYVRQDIVPNPMFFRPKGETYYPSVALSSVLSRYAFLVEWEKMEARFHTEIPKGASALVDKVYGRLCNTYGQKAIDPYVKTFFANYKKR